jgi:hypothetical protein
VVHSSIGKSTFEICFSFLSPSPLDVVYGHQGGVMEDTMGEALKAKKFVENIRQIHLQEHNTLKRSRKGTMHDMINTNRKIIQNGRQILVTVE